MRHVNTEKPSWGLRPAASTAHRRSSERPRQTHLAIAVPPALCTYITKKKKKTVGTISKKGKGN
jgi:hypothetical protein